MTTMANDISGSLDKNVFGLVHDSEGNSYRTVKIGDQTWLADNLRSTRFQDGSPVDTGFIANNDPATLRKYGRLYNWHDVTNQRGLCPPGWKVPSDDDWKTLEASIGVKEEDLDKTGWRGDDDVAIALKAAQPNSPFKSFDQTKVNRYRFNATPAGVKVSRWYITEGMYTEFWTSSTASDASAYARTLAYSWWNSHKGEIRRTTLNKSYMLTVRCILA